MRDQLRFENSVKQSFTDLFTKPSNRKRILLAVLVQVFTQTSGINVINYYQTDLYKGLGYQGHMITLLASIYGMVGPIANVICLYFVDKWGRKKTLWITGIIMTIDISLVMAMTASFTKTTNMVGKGFAICFIFLFSIIYSLGYNSIHYIYVPEIMTMAIRARGSSIAVCSNVLINILFNQVSPIAFAHVGYKYYSLFICTNAVGAVVVFLMFPETKGKSLEEIGAIFGDEVITPDLDTTQTKMEALPNPEDEQIENQVRERTTTKGAELGH
jgi:MFS family permease